MVVGGPPVHAGYIDRLFKAEARGKIAFDRIVVVDRDPSCAAATRAGDRVRLAISSWDAWLSANLSAFGAADHLVPYHWAPHVLLDWLGSELRQRGFALTRNPDLSAPPASPPVRRGTQAGDLAMSYAEWLCPPSCIEPALCPHTRGPKIWSLATELGGAADSFVFPCMHLAHGVGTIPLRSIFEVRDRIASRLESDGGSASPPLWISSASHCHGLGARVEVTRAPKFSAPDTSGP